MLEQIEWVRQYFIWLFNYEWIHTSYVYFNLYSVVHFLTGILIMKALFYYDKNLKRNWYFFIAIIVAWELLEWSTAVIGMDLFRKDPTIDTLYDIILGVLGAGVFIRYFKK